MEYVPQWSSALAERVENARLQICERRKVRKYTAGETPVDDGAVSFLIDYVAPWSENCGRVHSCLEAQTRCSARLEAFGRLRIGSRHMWQAVLVMVTNSVNSWASSWRRQSERDSCGGFVSCKMDNESRSPQSGYSKIIHLNFNQELFSLFCHFMIMIGRLTYRCFSLSGHGWEYYKLDAFLCLPLIDKRQGK